MGLESKEEALAELGGPLRDAPPEEEAEMDPMYAAGLIDGVLAGISDSETGGALARRAKRAKKVLSAKRRKEIPEFEIEDIMGEFDVDDMGNYIIVRGNDMKLYDKRDKRVNRRGYTVDSFGNVIDRHGRIIFKVNELDSEDEIPAPFSFEKRKKHLLGSGPAEFELRGTIHPEEIDPLDDEELIERELRRLKKMGGKGSDGESSVESMMADTPAKYTKMNNPRAARAEEVKHEDEVIIDISTKPPRSGKKTRTTSGEAAVDPNRKPVTKSDVKMAKVYGGKTRGAAVHSPTPQVQPHTPG